jgi:hypothetical protein
MDNGFWRLRLCNLGDSVSAGMAQFINFRKALFHLITIDGRDASNSVNEGSFK